MIIASCITMRGAAAHAARLYADIFELSADISLFGEHERDLGMDVPDECKKLVYRAELSHEGRCQIVLVDSLALLYGGYSPNVEMQGNADGVVLEVANGGEQWVRGAFTALMRGGKANFAPRQNADGAWEASLIDRFAVCWILRSEASHRSEATHRSEASLRSEA